jgi:hypothetical protein
MGSYSYFGQGVPVFATSAFEIDDPPGGELRDLLTIFLSAAGTGGITHLVSSAGGSSTAANPEAAVSAGRRAGLLTCSRWAVLGSNQ